jgi:hypothetical protein
MTWSGVAQLTAMSAEEANDAFTRSGGWKPSLKSKLLAAARLTEALAGFTRTNHTRHNS